MNVLKKWVFLFLFTFVSPLAAFAQTTVSLTETPKSADSLVDSIGVNIHMTFGNTAYNDVAVVKKMLATLGIRHVRDGGKYYPNDPRYNEYEFGTYGKVASLGIGFDLILDFFGGVDPNPMTPALMAALQSLATKNGVTIDSYEGPNEADIAGNKNWIADTRSFMASVYSSVKTNATTSIIPVIGNSLAGPSTNWSLLGNMAAHEDYGNMHPYANTQHPSYNFAADLANQINVSGSQPIWVTEAGWSNAMNANDNTPNVSEDASGRYMGRLFLETLLHGWPRTYVYELVDNQADSGMTNNQKHFGLFRNDYSAKPAATVIANMIALMSDKGYTVVPRPLSYSLTTASSAVHHLVFQKHDGSYWLALWQEISNWKGWNAQGTAIANPEVAVKLTLTTTAASIQTYRPHDSTAVVESFKNQKTITLMVPDHPLLVVVNLIAPPSNPKVVVR
jgi:hypothetical protein